MIMTEEVEVRPRGVMIQYYRDKGYDVNYNQPILIKVNDLSKSSHIYIDVKCDICGEIRNVRYKDYNKIIENGNYYCCPHCSRIKTIETNRIKYNCNNVMQNKDIYAKQSKSLQNNYGVTTPLKNQEIKKRVENTMLKNLGVKCSFKSDDVQNKIRETLLQKYGVDSPSKALEVKEKKSNTIYRNGTTPTSKQQLYVFNLYKYTNNLAKLNYPISYYNADICFPNENLAIEIDFGGHNLSVKLGNLTQEEFDKKELIRNNVIKREGYKQMRIISNTDKLPSDSVLLQMLQDARNYFFQYPNHSWIQFNIDTSTVHNAEYKEGVFFNYGNLRKITKAQINDCDNLELVV